jgi:truncated hemoglobin YjbI
MRAELAELMTSIGGESVLFSILNEFYLRMSKDLMIGFFFDKHDLEHIALMQGKFVLNAAGLISSYDGKGPSTAHIALPPILSGHFDRRLVILRETLTAQGLSENQIKTWVRFEESFRAIVVSD